MIMVMILMIGRGVLFLNFQGDVDFLVWIILIWIMCLTIWRGFSLMLVRGFDNAFVDFGNFEL